jgi:hypothetical protein
METRTGFRALLVGIILIFADSFWMMNASIFNAGYPTTVSLFYDVILILFVLTCANLLLTHPRPLPRGGLLKYFKRAALNRAELLMIYAMLSISSAICGLDMLQVLIPLISGAIYLATPENEWESLFFKYIPDWIAVKDKEALMAYDLGESTLYSVEHLRSWLTPILIWAGFIFVLLFVMVCINSLLRRQWTEGEKLSYPIIQLPSELTKPGFLKNNLLWIGFAIAGGMDAINGLHFLYPVVPGIGGRLYDIGPLFTEKPWNAIGWTPAALFPYAVGMAFFIPLDLSFSCWFFYLFWKSELIFSSILGLRNLPNFPYIDQQSSGAYLGLLVIAMWSSRKYLGQIFKKVVKNDDEILPDAGEPMKYRTALLGVIGGMIVLVLFCRQAGMSIWVAVVFFLLYFALSTAITRMRAELGSPVHDLHFAGPDMILTTALNTRRFTPNDLTIMSFFHFFNRAYRSHPMPHQLEAFKLAERSNMNNKRLLWALLIAAGVGVLTSSWAYLDAAYRYGGKTGYAWRPFGNLERWLSNPSPPDYPATAAILIGFLIATLLYSMRTRFFWWAFHPAGFAVSSSWSMNLFWPSILVSWLIKLIILKYGGVNLHRKVIPFFLGLILGEFVVGGFWTLRGALFHTETYKFLF